MKISKIKIQNFRSIQSLEMEIPQICALVGPNNTGKSNILQAIQRVLGKDWVTVTAFDEDDVYSRNPTLDITIEVCFEPTIEYSQIKGADKAQIASLWFQYSRYKRGDKTGERRLQKKCHNADGNVPNVQVNARKTGVQPKFEPIVGIPGDVTDSIPFIYIGTNRSLKDQLPGGRASLLRQLLEDVNKDFHAPDNVTSKVNPDGSTSQVSRSKRFEELMDEAMKLLRTDSFDTLETAIKQNAFRMLGFDPKLDTDKLDFFFCPIQTIDFYKSLELCVKENNVTVNASELGDGMQNALVLAILQAFEERRKKGAIILIEEPEMFLHPQMQRSLYKTIRELGETNQVIYTTHSPHFVTIPQHDEVRLVRKDAQGTNVKKSDLVIDNKLREKLRKELDPERNELFFARRLLLVEGDTEKLAFPEYAKRLNIDLDREGATIVEVGGKKSLLDFAQIACSFGIPTGILYDTDSSDYKNDRDKEKEYNGKLDACASADGNVKVWKFPKDYEGTLKETITDSKYQEMCQKLPSLSKPVRARLIAMEESLSIPPVFEEILRWLGNKPLMTTSAATKANEPTQMSLLNL